MAREQDAHGHLHASAHACERFDERVASFGDPLREGRVVGEHLTEARRDRRGARHRVAHHLVVGARAGDARRH